MTRAALGHTSWTQTFVDPSRPTILTHSPSLPSRTLVTAIYRPNGKGQFPLIVFAHGALGNPGKFTKLFAAWADAGYVVVAPTFPLTNDHAPELRLNDAAQQPADMSFVLDNVLAMDKQRGSRLFRTIDHHRIGAGGLSLGGYTTYVLVYGDCCRDARIRAVEILDGTERALALDGHVPLLIAHSDTDPTIPYSSARDSFNSASPPAWLVRCTGRRTRRNGKTTSPRTTTSPSRSRPTSGTRRSSEIIGRARSRVSSRMRPFPASRRSSRSTSSVTTRRCCSDSSLSRCQVKAEEADGHCHGLGRQLFVGSFPHAHAFGA